MVAEKTATEWLSKAQLAVIRKLRFNSVLKKSTSVTVAEFNSLCKVLEMFPATIILQAVEGGYLARLTRQGLKVFQEEDAS